MLSGFFNWNILIFLSKRPMSIVWFENSFLKLIRANLRYSHDNIFLKTFKILWPKHTSHMIFLINFLTIFTKKSMFDFAFKHFFCCYSLLFTPIAILYWFNHFFLLVTSFCARRALLAGLHTLAIPFAER